MVNYNQVTGAVNAIESAPYLFSGELESQGASIKCGPCGGSCYGPPGPACSGPGGCRPGVESKGLAQKVQSLLA